MERDSLLFIYNRIKEAQHRNKSAERSFAKLELALGSLKENRFDVSYHADMLILVMEAASNANISFFELLCEANKTLDKYE